MCGIAGFAGSLVAAGEAPSRVRAMCDAIVHRGPDSDGYHVADGIALGMRRLSIIDVAGGRQPISNEDGTVTVVFNGEIYNHHDLRRELEAQGHRFRTHSDTEVLVHLYEEHGPDMAARLDGMFAFAIWDEPRRRLLLARDRAGQKPLCYFPRADGLVFCSELRSLWAFDPAPLSVSPAAVVRYLAFGYVPDPDTIFEGVRKLPPAHLLTWSEAEGLSVRRYWSPPRPETEATADDDAVARLRELLDKAVRSHLESEVPLGAFLSGGLDSSTVVALMCRHAQGRVKTFSIGFSDPAFDESAAAREVARALGTEHREIIVNPDVEHLFEAVALLFDEPFADSSAIPTFLVSQLARQSVTVALSGDGGDELFGGYSRYGETLGRIGGTHASRRLLGAIGLALPHIVPGRNRLVDCGRSDWGRYAATVVHPVRVDEGGVALAGVRGSATAVSEQLAGRLSREVGDDFAAAMMLADFETYLPGDILSKVDRASMSVSLESRVPLLDNDLVEFALGIPGPSRVTALESKRLFRKAIRGVVPDVVLTRPKQGFAIPLGRWFRGPLRHRVEALRQRPRSLEPYVDAGATARLAREHLMGRRDHSGMIWRLIVLDCWLSSLPGGTLGRPPALPALPASLVGA